MNAKIMESVFKRFTPFHWFIVKAIGLYSIWLIVYHNWGEGPGGFDDQMTLLTAKLSGTIMNWFGYESGLEFNGLQRILVVNGQQVVGIADRCNGLQVMSLYAGFIIAYPGKWKMKVPFIVAGVAIVFLLNILRVIGLTFNMMYYKASFEFNHKYTFTFAIYAVIFALWMVWANRFSSVKFKSAV